MFAISGGSTWFNIILQWNVLELALINRAGGLYGKTWSWPRLRVRTERSDGLCTRSRSRFSYTDRLRSVNIGVFVIRQTRKFNLWCNWFALTDILLETGDELDWNLWILFEENSPAIFWISECKFSTSKCNLSRWENLDPVIQYQFQPIKFVNMVVPSLCETQSWS